MAVIIVEPDGGYASWLAGAVEGLCDRVARTPGPDGAMAALAAAGGGVLATVIGPGVPDQDAIALAGRLQEAAPDVSVLLVRAAEGGELLRTALRAGVKDVLPADAAEDAVRASAARAVQIARALRGRLAGAAPAPAGEQAAPRGKVVTVFSSKGGCGKTFLATNLALALAQRGGEVALVDLDLAFGDVAIMLRLSPAHTLRDAALTAGLDATALKSFLTRHKAGLWTLAAPLEPTAADAVTPAAVATVLRLLRADFDHVVVDTPAAFTDHVLAAVDQSDAIAAVAGLDVPSVKNLKLTLQTLELLKFPRSRVRLLLNRADAKVDLRLADVEKALGTSIDAQIPSSRSVPLSINRGDPLVLAEPRSKVSEAIRGIAADLAAPLPPRPAPVPGRRQVLAPAPS
jgi:pilus assembly protein CpaE